MQDNAKISNAQGIKINTPKEQQNVNSSNAAGTNSKAIATLLQLEKNAREAEDLAALYYTIVNELSLLVPYRQTLLYIKKSNSVVAASSSSTVDGQTSFISFIKKLNEFYLKDDIQECVLLNKESIEKEFLADFEYFCEDHIILVPLLHKKYGLVGSIAVIRHDPFKKPEITLLKYISGTYAHAYMAIKTHKENFFTNLFKKEKRKKVIYFLIALLIVMLFPVRLSALGQAEVVSKDLVVLRSPLEGAIDSVLVEPNQAVKKSHPLVKLDVTNLSNQLAMANKERDVERVRYLQMMQRSLDDPRYAAQIAQSKAIVEQKQAEINYLQGMLARSVIYSPIDGVAIFEDKNSLVGQPLHIGTKVISVASPYNTELVVYLSEKDALELGDEASIVLFLNVAPNEPIDAVLKSYSYVAVPRPEGYMAYRLVANFKDLEKDKFPRVGLRGVAKVYGNYVPLIYYFLRRPIQVMRQYIGL